MDRIKDLLKEVYERGINVKSAEIKALQAQINPHFLYNTLDSICWVAHDIGNIEIPEVISSLSDILRYSLNNSDKLATIAEELDITRKYLDIQRFCYSLDISLIEDISNISYEYKLPKITLQPIIENAIKHGTLQQGKNSDVITIHAFHRSDKVVIQVEDDNEADIALMYSIINDKTETQKHGIKNIHSRFNMMFGSEYGLNFIKSEHGGIIVEILLPG
jgi:two-component system sensor histidine kinase YesM